MQSKLKWLSLFVVLALLLLGSVAMASAEVNSPDALDSDGDGLANIQEDVNQDGKIAGDTNNNRILDPGETWTETDPFDKDSDNDLLEDGFEWVFSSQGPANVPAWLATMYPQFSYIVGQPAACGTSSPMKADASRDADVGGQDGLNNSQEFGVGTNPCVKDSDGDGLIDGDEVNDVWNPGTWALPPTNPLDPDSDDDGLTDGAEALDFLTDPTTNDTDGDGMLDGWEVQYPACMQPTVTDAGR